MDIKAMEKVGKFLKDASSDELMSLAEKMATDKPERARKLVQLELSHSEPNEDYIKGLVDGLWFGELLTDDERDEFKSKLTVND